MELTLVHNKKRGCSQIKAVQSWRKVSRVENLKAMMMIKVKQFYLEQEIQM